MGPGRPSRLMVERTVVVFESYEDAIRILSCIHGGVSGLKLATSNPRVTHAQLAELQRGSGQRLIHGLAMADGTFRLDGLGWA